MFCVLFSLLSLSGCYKIRKKFTRKKKYRKEPPVYVDFKDYSEIVSRQSYVDYYLFTRGWLQDLAESLREEGGFGRKKRAVNEAIMNLGRMASFYGDGGEEKIKPLRGPLLIIKEEIESDPNMTEVRRAILRAGVEHLKRKFETEFNYAAFEREIK